MGNVGLTETHDKLSITLPSRDGQSIPETCTDLSSLVIVGPNGSGKSKLGYWIETNQTTIEVHRVAAQRALTFPDVIQPLQYKRAETILLYGDEHGSRKHSRRWREKPTTILLDDFHKMLVLMFADEARRNKEYTGQARQTAKYHDVPASRIEILLRIWHQLLPQRKLILEDEKVQASIEGENPYEGSEMSDGERVALYLIGQCLSAPKQSIIVIDEPEIHLHKAIQSALWDRIEASRLDCLFVYITHDLDFAASRTSARKIHVKEYDGSKWKWEDVPDIDELPETILLEIMGSRRNVLFVEGEKESLDYSIYALLYPGHLVVPRGSFQKVIEATKAMSSLPSLVRHLNICGIIDRDRRTDSEVDSLRQQHVYCSDVSEVENLLCIEEVVRIIARDMRLEADETFQKVKQFVVSELQREIESQISRRASAQIKLELGRFEAKGNTRAEVAAGYAQFVGSIDVNAIYGGCSDLFQGLLTQTDYFGILKHYKRKSLLSRISDCFGLKDSEYEEYVLRQMRSENEELRKEKAKRDTPKDETEQQDTTEQPQQPKEEKRKRVVEVLKAYVPNLD